MSTSRPEPSSTEAMAFQLVLAELHTHQEGLQALQQTVQQMLTLQAKIVGLLEAQGRQPDVPVATWDQVYDPVEDVPALPDVENVQLPEDIRPSVIFGSRRLARWFYKETPSGDA
jgi:hypothetical protein